MVIYIIFILVVLLFLLIGGLFALLLKPEWLEDIRIKLNILSSKTINKKNTPPVTQFINVPSVGLTQEQELYDVKSHIHNLLDPVSDSVKSFSIGKEQPLHDAIKKFNNYLYKSTVNELFLVKTLYSEILQLDTSLPGDENYLFRYSELTAQIEKMNNLFFIYFSSNDSYINIIKNFYKSALEELNKELLNFRKLKEILANSSTIKVYESAKKKYSWAFYIYLLSFFSTIYATLHFSLYIIQQKKHYLNNLGMDIYDYWTIKISAIFIFITVITFLIKQAAHYQKKKDEAERTMLELKALPSYLADLESQDAINLRKDLATKYFGNSNDNSTLNEIGNLISEQLKNSTEVAKSSAEVIKVLKNKNN